MLRKVLLFIAVITSINLFGQVTLSREQYDNLPEDIKRELSTSKEMKKYSDYASWGKEIGVAVNETLKAVEESSIRISKTEIGQSAIFILKWKFLYKDFVRLITGTILLILCVILILKMIFGYNKEIVYHDEKFIISTIASICTFITALACLFS